MSDYESERIPIVMHPKAFSAFGADLVTSDVVALIELVKNAYDAFAYNVEVIFDTNPLGDRTLTIVDDGLGMTKDIIVNAWAVIATNNKLRNPYIERDGKIRAVSGNKGMGRFSAARLGTKLSIITKTKEEGCYRIELDWNNFNTAHSIEECGFILEKADENEIAYECGTRLVISNLSHIWDEDELSNLEEELSRIINPFTPKDEFNILLKYDGIENPIEISVPNFVNTPKYLFTARVDSNGNVAWEYSFSPLKRGIDFSNQSSGTLMWNEILENLRDELNRESQKTFKVLSGVTPTCGAFSMEIRVWDRDAESIQDITELYSIKRALYKNTLRAYKGLSVYRDGILVLPKSEASRDWIGLDLRRVGRIGDRISTNQIIGIVNISSSANPNIKDATDREKLVDTIEYLEFTTIIKSAIKLLENLRKNDRMETDGQVANGTLAITDLLAGIDSTNLVSEVENKVKNGGTIEDLVQIVKDFNSDSQERLEDLKDRLVYYGQVASVGSISGFIIHEIRGRMTSVKRYLDASNKEFSPLNAKLQRYYDLAVTAHSRMIDVSNTFAPIFDAGLRQRKNYCNLLQEINNSIALLEKKITDNNTQIIVECKESVVVPMHRGELQTALINVIDNAIYWTAKNNEKDNRKISINVSFFNKKQIIVEISDNGPGVSENDANRIFAPGVTKKKFGVGMGLVIVTEILNKYDSQISTVIPGKMGGATFQMTLPYKENNTNESIND